MAKKKKFPALMVSLVLVVGLAGFLIWQKISAPRLIPAGEILERCYQLHTGEKIAYRFQGEDMVSFDIRRGGDSMMAPRVVPSDEGAFVADSDGEYCLRFGNALTRAQKIEYSVKRSLASPNQ